MRVRVPASIANLGPGFDVLAMAVELWLEVEAEPADSPDWTFEGEGAGFLNDHSNPLSVLSMRGHVRSEIPMGVGLGSSAAARVAAWALRGHPQPWVPAGEEEGHRDNAAAAALGGLRLTVDDTVAELPVPDVEVALLVAQRPQSTDAARELLPERVPLADAVFNAGRLAWLVSVLYRGGAAGNPALLDDRLHQPYRKELYPWAHEAMRAARRLGLPAAIAGAGPTVFALADPGRGREVAEAMAASAPGRGRPMVTRIARSGMKVDP